MIVDSLSHAWAGVGGVLEIVSEVTLSSKSQNPYTEGWRTATPLHNRLVDTLLQYPGHVIATVRSKTKRVLQDDGRGRQVPKDVGMEWVQRDGLEYEMDLVGEMDKAHTLTITKTRASALDGATFAYPGEELASLIVQWLQEGSPVRPRPAATAAPEAAKPPTAARPVTPVPTPVTGRESGPHEDLGPHGRPSLTGKSELLQRILAKLVELVPGEPTDPVVEGERFDIVRQCFGSGVENRKLLVGLPLGALRVGWEALETWQKEEPPPVAAREGPEGLVGGEGAEDGDSDELATGVMLQQLRRLAAVVGVTRELEDLIAGYVEDHGGEAWEEGTRTLFFQEVCDTLPTLTDAIDPLPHEAAGQDSPSGIDG